MKNILKVKPIPVPKNCKHPEPPNSILPKHEFTLAIISPKGAGKTTLIANLLDFYRYYFHDIFVFSPTFHSDEKWDWVKNQELLIENYDLKKWISNELKKQQSNLTTKIIQDPPLDIRLKGILTNRNESFDGKIPEENFFSVYNEEDLQKIVKEQDDLIKLLEEFGQKKYLANRKLFIFDDQVGSSLFSNNRNNFFKGFNTRHRHSSASIIIVSQGYKEIPATIRVNYSALILFEISNNEELIKIYRENPVGLTFDQWMEMFKHSTSDDFSFLYMNFKRIPKKLRCMKNFDKFLIYEKE